MGEIKRIQKGTDTYMERINFKAAISLKRKVGLGLG